MSLDPQTAVTTAYDLGLAALQSFDKGKFSVTLDRPDYVFCNEVIKNATIKDGGKYETFEVALGKTGNASHVGYFEEYTPNVAQIMKEGSVNWAKAHTSYSYDIDEVNINTSSTEIYNLLSSRRTTAFVELADLLEPRALWTPNDATDKLNPCGVFTWLTLPADNTEGFVGYNPVYKVANTTSFNAGNITCSAGVNTGWANYAADYNGALTGSQTITSGVLDYLGTAMRKTNFSAPLRAEQVMDMNYNKFRIFTNNEVIKQLEKIARNSDDNLGYDLGKYNGMTTFKRMPLEYNSNLDFVTTTQDNHLLHGYNPIVGLNFNEFKCQILKGCNFRELPPMNDVKTPNVFTIHVDLQYRYIVKNRQRAGFLLCQV
jgi:hypothetical protein